MFSRSTAFTILDIVSTWAAHTAGTLPSGRPPSLATQRNEMRLGHWWADLGHTWGLRRQSVASPRDGPDRMPHHPVQQQQARYLVPKLSLEDSEASRPRQYDPRLGQSEDAPYPSSVRSNHDAHHSESRHRPERNYHGRDGEDDEPHSNKKRRLSMSIRRPYEGPQPDSFGPHRPEASFAANGAPSKTHGDFAALLTAAEYRAS